MKTPFLLTAIAAVTAGLALCGVSAEEPAELKNLALHKPYTLSPPPTTATPPTRRTRRS